MVSASTKLAAPAPSPKPNGSSIYTPHNSAESRPLHICTICVVDCVQFLQFRTSTTMKLYCMCRRHIWRKTQFIYIIYIYKVHIFLKIQLNITNRFAFGGKEKRHDEQHCTIYTLSITSMQNEMISTMFGQLFYITSSLVFHLRYCNLKSFFSGSYYRHWKSFMRSYPRRARHSIKKLPKKFSKSIRCTIFSDISIYKL